MLPYEEIETKIGYRFKEREWLRQAFTHSSLLNESKTVLESNERLEFLGDSLLGLFVSYELFLRYPNQDEGYLSSLKSILVSQKACIRYIEEEDLSQYLLFGKGESDTKKGRFLADLYEALLAALFLDGGMEPATLFFRKSAVGKFATLLKNRDLNWKFLLQDFLQRKERTQPTYRLLGQAGEPHCRLFFAEVCVKGQIISQGEGRSKQQAEQAAAKKAVVENGYRDEQTQIYLDL